MNHIRKQRKLRKQMKKYLDSYYDGDQAIGTEILLRTLLEIQRAKFVEDNEATTVYFVVDKLLKACKLNNSDLLYKKLREVVQL